MSWKGLRNVKSTIYVPFLALCVAKGKFCAYLGVGPTPDDRDAINDMAVGKTFAEAARKALG